MSSELTKHLSKWEQMDAKQLRREIAVAMGLCDSTSTDEEIGSMSPDWGNDFKAALRLKHNGVKLQYAFSVSKNVYLACWGDGMLLVQMGGTGALTLCRAWLEYEAYRVYHEQKLNAG